MRRVVGGVRRGRGRRSGAWAIGQERTGAVRVSVVPDRADWSYAIGAPARFRVTVTRDGHALAGTPVKVACGPEQMPPVDREDRDRRPRTASRSTAGR